MSKPRIIIHNHRAKDAPRGTLVGENPNEERDGNALVDEARKAGQEFNTHALDLRREAYEIAGTFRGPGLWAKCRSVMKPILPD